MARFALLVVAACVLLSVAAAHRPDKPSHDYNNGTPRLSVFNKETGEYKPVGSSKDYTYYRLHIKFDITFYSRFQPNATNFANVQAVFTGSLNDVASGEVAGEFEASGVTTNSPTAPGQSINIFISFHLDLGKAGDSAVLVQGTLSVNPITFAITGDDLAVIGGTGRYLGATGNFVLLVGSTLQDQLESYATVYVPRLPKF